MIPLRFHSDVRRRHGFTLLEILVAVGLLAVIMVGLLAGFYQAQRAFRAGTTQVDVLESGRAVMDLLVRELQQMTPAGQDGTNLYVETAYLPQLLQPRPQPAPPARVPPQTNRLQDCFFLSRENDQWTGIGYFVGNPDITDARAGTLYRFETRVAVTNEWQCFGQFEQARRQFPNVLTNVHRLADRVIHFRVIPYGFNGKEFLGLDPDDFAFTNNAVPAYLDVELGVLEPNAYDRYKMLAGMDVNEASRYLRDQIARVHLFRQRVSVRTGQ